MATTSEQMRACQGPAIFAFGFRPFFLGASLWAAIAMVLWIAMLSGNIVLPTALDPVSWHAHELLFGYLGAVIAGFLTTAVPNWTGRLPIVGWPLAMLFSLWVAGRFAIAFSAALTPGVAAAAELAFPVVFTLAIGREIIAGRNWRNLPVLMMLAVYIFADAWFLCEAALGEFAARGNGLRLGLGTALMMIALIGGRIVPSFTRNWLVKQGETVLPASPMQPFDKLAMLVLLLALALWIAAPGGWPTGIALTIAGLTHFVRLSRWRGHRTFGEPLVTVLHAGYAFLPLGALTVAAEATRPGLSGTGGQHLWMAGAIGLMTLAVMTRATLGHTGQALTASRGTVFIYCAIVTAVFARFVAGVAPVQAHFFYDLAGASWVAAFAGYVLIYGPLLLRRYTPKPD